MAPRPQNLVTQPARLETLLEVSRQLSRIQPLESLLTNMAEACGHLLDSDSVGIRVVEGDDLVLAAVHGDAQQAMPTPRIKIGESFTGIVVETGKPLAVWDPANDRRLAPAHREAYRRGGYRAFLGVPLKLGEQVLGVLSIRTRREHGFSPEDLGIVTAFAAQAAIAIENARLYRQTEERAEKLKTFTALSRLMTSAQDSSQVCDAVARAATTLLTATTTRVWVSDPLGRVLRTQGSFGTDPTVEEVMTDFPVISYGQGLVGRIVESRTPEFLLDIAKDPRWLNRRLATEGGLQSFAGVPLIADGDIVGVLAILFRERRSFTSEERELIALLADQAAIAIRNARLVQALKTRQTNLETLLDVSRQLSTIQPVESLLGAISEACGRLLGSESVGFRLVEGEELVLAGSWGDAKDVVITSPLRIGESLSGRVAARGEPLVVTDLVNDPRLIPAHRETFSRRGFRALMAVPVKVGERVVGVLSIRTRREEEFSAEDLMIATAFASQAAVALENARLYDKTCHTLEELQSTQEQLIQAQKMEAIGQLAGGIAHDFNNLLTVIMGRSQLLSRDPRAADSVRRGLEIIDKSAKTAAGLTRQLLAFSRKQVLQPQVLDLNTVVSSTNEMLRRLIGEDIPLVTLLDPAIGRVKADRGQIEQILMNLAVNARDAMPAGGRLTIETANVELDTPDAGRHVAARPEPHIMLAMSDTGVGMSRETLAHVFEPFFTTKEVGKGTGLGLSTVYGIVKQSGGRICVHSERGAGTTFKIYFPRVEASTEPAEGTITTSADVPRGSETILLVEDEGEVRALARDILQARGYTVLEAPDGAEALRFGQRHAGDMHLMLTDVVMPGMNGPELANRLSSLRPGMAVLYMSGYTDNAAVHHGVLDSGAAFLPKPIAPDTLVRKVRELLDQRTLAAANSA